MFLSDLNASQRQHLAHTEALWASWKTAMRNRAAMGTLAWKPTKGGDYLIHSYDDPTSGARKTVALGLRSASTTYRMTVFEKERESARQYLDGITQQLNEQARLNRAAGLGRIPKAAAAILRRFERDRLDFLTDHSAALLAYETLAGVSIQPKLLANASFNPADEIGKTLYLLPRASSAAALHSALRGVDRSFMPHEGGRQAINIEAYCVHLHDTIDCAAPVTALCIGEDGLPVAIPALPPHQFLLRADQLAKQADTPADRAWYEESAELVRAILHTKPQQLIETII